MIFELVQDLADVLEAMPPEHPRRRVLKLLDEAVRRDVHFLDRHPTAFFQCLWNTCWWYDCPQAAGHFEPAGTPGDGDAAGRLSRWLDSWRSAREADIPGFVWLRARRPPATTLG